MSALIFLKNREYIESRVKRADHGFSSQCWDWQKAVNAYGYAHGWPPVQRKPMRMCRVAYEAFIGPIPDGLEIDHLCRNRRCVNPDHLEAVTRAENQRRVQWKRSGTCLHGHAWVEENIKIYPNGQRTCRLCNEAWYARRRASRERAA